MNSFTFLVLALVIALEIVLSLDNALALSLMVRGLKEEQRKKALFIGMVSGYILRGVGIFFAAKLIHFTWVQVIAGLYLVKVGVSFFWSQKKEKKVTPSSFWMTVLKIEVVDLMFALDSIFAALALVTTYEPGHLWIVYLGVFVGMLAMRFAASKLTRLIDKYPRLECSAHLIIAWIGLKLIASPFVTFSIDPIFWGGMVLLFILGLTKIGGYGRPRSR